MKLLIVEDDRFYAQMLTELLHDRGLEVEVRGSVQDAIQAVRGDVDGYIIDVMLPNDPESTGISEAESRGGYAAGVALARRIRQQYKNAPIVLLTGGADYGTAQDWAGDWDIPFVNKGEGEHALFGALERLRLLPNPPAPKAFVVHGHDEGTLAEVVSYIRDSLRWQEPVVLRDAPSAGRTIIEKFEEYASRVDCVFVILTPDDVVIQSGTDDEKRHSRPNVIFELGFFYAQLGRRSGRTLLLHKGPVELPSDIQGIVWIDISNGVAAADKTIRAEVSRFVRS
jgi:CheY-like chemotaxis protein